MASYDGITLMGEKPVAGRVRAHACAGRSIASTHGTWLLGSAKSTTPIFTAMPDTNGTRRPRGQT